MREITVPIILGEVVKAEVYRAQPWGYAEQPSETLCVEDLITNAGRTFLARRINGGDTVASAMAYMAVGSGNAAPALTDTALTHEVHRKLSAISSATANNVYTNVATWGGAADGVTSIEIKEAAVFNGSNAGTMFQRVTFAAVTLADSDLLKVTLETVVGSNTI